MAKKKLKVLMVVHCFLPESVGGAEFYTFNLSKLLREKGYDVAVVAALQDTTLERYKTISTEFEGLRVTKIVNSPYLAHAFVDYFLDPHVDVIYQNILRDETPDLVHFQHIPYLSGRLPEITFQMRIPSLFTLHDYWYICRRSQLLRPGCGPCPGPSDGVYCATCYDITHAQLDPTPALKYRKLTRLLQSPIIRKLNLKETLHPTLKQKLKMLLYEQPHTPPPASVNPHIITLLENTFRSQFFRRQFSFPHFVLSPSYHLKKRFENEGYREILHLPLGFFGVNKVSPPAFAGKLKLAYLGNIVPFKGALVIAKELQKVHNRHRLEVHFHGRPNDRLYFEELQRAARDFPEQAIYFHGGYRSDKELRDILSQVHVVVFPSLWEENYPLVVREALMHGIPVIGSRLGGVPEAIEDGVNGFLFDPYKEGDLAEKISRILDKSGTLEKITEGARATKIESMEDHIEKIIRLYEGALSQRQPIQERGWC